VQDLAELLYVLAAMWHSPRLNISSSNRVDVFSDFSLIDGPSAAADVEVETETAIFCAAVSNAKVWTSDVIRVARFVFGWHPKTGKMHQITTKCTKGPWNIRNVSKIDLTAIKFTSIFHCKTLKKLPKFGFFGLKIYHLASWM
jgi:hypothetical protein